MPKRNQEGRPAAAVKTWGRSSENSAGVKTPQHPHSRKRRYGGNILERWGARPRWPSRGRWNLTLTCNQCSLPAIEQRFCPEPQFNPGFAESSGIGGDGVRLTLGRILIQQFTSVSGWWNSEFWWHRWRQQSLAVGFPRVQICAAS